MPRTPLVGVSLAKNPPPIEIEDRTLEPSGLFGVIGPGESFEPAPGGFWNGSQSVRTAGLAVKCDSTQALQSKRLRSFGEPQRKNFSATARLSLVSSASRRHPCRLRRACGWPYSGRGDGATDHGSKSERARIVTLNKVIQEFFCCSRRTGCVSRFATWSCVWAPTLKEIGFLQGDKAPPYEPTPPCVRTTPRGR